MARLSAAPFSVGAYFRAEPPPPAHVNFPEVSRAGGRSVGQSGGRAVYYYSHIIYFMQSALIRGTSPAALFTHFRKHFHSSQEAINETELFILFR